MALPPTAWRAMRLAGPKHCDHVVLCAARTLEVAQPFEIPDLG
jgi:hypothetical protein